MKHLLIGVAALALMTGCNKTDKPGKGTEVKLTELTVRTGDASKASDALAAMSLTDSGSGVLSFADKKIDGATATFSDVEIAGEDGVQAGSLVFEGLDMADGKATFGKMSLSNIVVVVDETEDGELKIGNIELTNPSTELATWLTGTLNGQEVPFPAADKLVFDSWSMTGLSGNFSEDGNNGTFGVDKIEIRDMNDTIAKRMLISGISLDVDGDGEAVKVNLGSMTMTNVNTKFIKAIRDNIGDEDAMMSSIMDVAYENPMDPGFDSFVMDDFSVDADGISFQAPSLVTTVDRNSAGQPVKFITKPFTMTLSADADGGEAGAQLLTGLSTIGYESLTLKGESVATYDPDKDILNYNAKTNYFELVDGAKFSFGGKIEGYGEYNKAVGSSFNFADMADGAEPDPEAMMEAAGKLTFHSFEFGIDDDGLLDRAFNAAATAQGQDPAEMKSQISMVLGMAPMMVGDTGIDMALVTETTGALSKFIADGGKLTFKINPKTPLAVADIMANPDPSAYTKESLGFSATHK